MDTQCQQKQGLGNHLDHPHPSPVLRMKVEEIKNLMRIFSPKLPSHRRRRVYCSIPYSAENMKMYAAARFNTPSAIQQLAKLLDPVLRRDDDGV